MTVKNTTYNITEPPSKGWNPSFDVIPGLNSDPIDYKLLKNRP